MVSSVISRRLSRAPAAGCAAALEAGGRLRQSTVPAAPASDQRGHRPGPAAPGGRGRRSAALAGLFCFRRDLLTRAPRRRRARMSATRARHVGLARLHGQRGTQALQRAAGVAGLQPREAEAVQGHGRARARRHRALEVGNGLGDAAGLGQRPRQRQQHLGTASVASHRFAERSERLLDPPGAYPGQPQLEEGPGVLRVLLEDARVVAPRPRPRRHGPARGRPGRAARTRRPRAPPAGARRRACASAGAARADQHLRAREQCRRVARGSWRRRDPAPPALRPRGRTGAGIRPSARGRRRAPGPRDSSCRDLAHGRGALARAGQRHRAVAAGQRQSRGPAASTARSSPAAQAGRVRASAIARSSRLTSAIPSLGSRPAPPAAGGAAPPPRYPSARQAARRLGIGVAPGAVAAAGGRGQTRPSCRCRDSTTPGCAAATSRVSPGSAVRSYSSGRGASISLKRRRCASECSGAQPRLTRVNSDSP